MKKNIPIIKVMLVYQQQFNAIHTYTHTHQWKNREKDVIQFSFVSSAHTKETAEFVCNSNNKEWAMCVVSNCNRFF